MRLSHRNVGADPVETGGAPRFLDFLADELQPWVRDRYAVSDDAAYIGNSLGGLFGVYTLLHRPAAFRRYIIGSPWLCWDVETTTAYEPAYAADHSDLDATVFLAAGAHEDVLPPGLSRRCRPTSGPPTPPPIRGAWRRRSSNADTPASS